MSADKPPDNTPPGYIKIVPAPGDPTIALPFYPRSKAQEMQSAEPPPPENAEFALAFASAQPEPASSSQQSMQPAEPAQAEIPERSALALASAQTTAASPQQTPPANQRRWVREETEGGPQPWPANPRQQDEAQPCPVLAESSDDEDDDCNGDDCCNIGNDRRNGFLFRVDIFVVASSLFVVRDGINGSAKSQFAQITQSKRIVRGSEHFHIVGLPS